MGWANTSVMRSLGILSFVNHVIVAILAGLGHVSTEWVTPLDRRDISD